MKVQRFLFVFLLAVLALQAAPGPAGADVDDFEFESFHAEYQLGRDGDRRSTLRTRETLVALFPERDQNRGIVRRIPNHHRDVDVDLRVVSVTDEHGAPRDHAVERDGDHTVITIAVPKGSYVHGRRVYVVEYTQRDVTVSRSGGDEFYWDVNGTGWAQDFGRVSARVQIAPDLAGTLDGASACYWGPAVRRPDA